MMVVMMEVMMGDMEQVNLVQAMVISSCLLLILEAHLSKKKIDA